MAIMQNDKIRKVVQVHPDQSYEYEVMGDKSKWSVTKYYWHGQKWEELARAFAYSGFPSYFMSSFIGGTINTEKKAIFVRGGFTFHQLTSRHAPRLVANPHFYDLEKIKESKERDPLEASRLWEFHLSNKKRIKLPFYNEKFDELSFHINGLALAEEWDNWSPAPTIINEEEAA
jgi:hypothetical protein